MYLTRVIHESKKPKHRLRPWRQQRKRRRQLPPPLGLLLVEVAGATLEHRRSTFLGRLKPVSSRVSLLLPAAPAPRATHGQGPRPGALAGVVFMLLCTGTTFNVPSLHSAPKS